jgi:hypothetical protein
MSEDPTLGPDGQPATDRRVSRRRFVAGGVALGAAIVWGVERPFARAAIGQVIRTPAVGGTTGTTGPTGTTGTTGTSGPTGTTGTTGTTGKTGTTGHKHHDKLTIGLAGKTLRVRRHGKSHYVTIPVKLSGSTAVSGHIKVELSTGRHASLGSAAFHVKPGHENKVHVKLGAHTMHELSKARHHRLRVRIVASAAGATSAHDSVTIES